MLPKNSLKSFFVLSLFLASTSLAFAASYDIKEMTPEINQALQGRQSRFSELQQLKLSGAAGEDNQGYVKALKPDADSVVSAENSDRRIIYTAIVAQHNLGPTGLSLVEQGFGEVQRDRARDGDSIQLPSGEWTKK